MEARSKRGAAATLRAILEGRGEDTADAILERSTTGYTIVTVGGENDAGQTVWVANTMVRSGKAPGEIDDEELLAFIQSAHDRKQGSPPRHQTPGEGPIVVARIYRVPGHPAATSVRGTL